MHTICTAAVVLRLRVVWASNMVTPNQVRASSHRYCGSARAWQRRGIPAGAGSLAHTVVRGPGLLGHGPLASVVRRPAGSSSGCVLCGQSATAKSRGLLPMPARQRRIRANWRSTGWFAPHGRSCGVASRDARAVPHRVAWEWLAPTLHCGSGGTSFLSS